LQGDIQVPVLIDIANKEKRFGYSVLASDSGCFDLVSGFAFFVEVAVWISFMTVTSNEDWEELPQRRDERPHPE
jgi:hypothetical protein